MSRAAELIEEIESIGGEIWVEGTELVISPGDAAMPVLEELREHKPEIIALLQSRTSDRNDDLLSGEWMLEHCAYDDRCWSGVSVLFFSLAQWRVERGQPIPISRQAFVASLLDEGFRVTSDGLVSGLILRTDLGAHQAFQKGWE